MRMPYRAAPSAPVICGSAGTKRAVPSSFSKAALMHAFFATPPTKAKL
ncbi:MAG: hypothetical protein ACUVWK_06165 [Nitrososphaerales archaeon]